MLMIVVFLIIILLEIPYLFIETYFLFILKLIWFCFIHLSRNAEKEWIEERDAETAGQEWEKIAKMCDFNSKAARNSKDTSRMRSIMLQLKNQ